MARPLIHAVKTRWKPTKEKDIYDHLGTRDLFFPLFFSSSDDSGVEEASESPKSRSSSSMTGSKCSSTKDGCFVEATGCSARYSCDSSSI